MLFLMAQRWQQGYLYEANNAWHVRYCVMEQGIRKQKSKRLCDGDLPNKIVRQLFTEFMAKVNDDQHPGQASSSDTAVVKFWDDIYWPFAQENLKPSTWHGYKQVWNQHLKDHFGTTLLRDYRTPRGSLFLTELAKTYGKRTVQHVRSLASGIFAHAVATGHVESNPWHDVKVLGRQIEPEATESYTLEEIENVISALVEHVEAQLVMALSFFAGLRKGEIQGLQWHDIDQNYIHVRRAVTRSIVGTPKTNKSIRSIPIIEPVRVLLVLWRSKSRGDGWMFPNERGNPIELKDMARRVIRPALKKAGVQWKGFHAGRRGLGTTLRTLTGNSNAGRDVLGHNTTQVTETHYEDRMPEEVLKGMKLLEAKVTK
jgi:integrase